ncbi:hypothetical protein A8C56_15160 [Niabella ginsenosidivorans]|uniref:TonB C-terminal domain-containing protein n=1 Tax=Niabella ginsenosidivorans TaxID=1176587 RepID=A0A1A9I618_9BACT|nr:hypothetical protein [Niabella ginsenosidivorans]ANH82131.1 hypothetical protein A8C56_15160 [Niabella ginsenosidivorans]
MKNTTALIILFSLLAAGEKGIANNNFNCSDTIPQAKTLSAVNYFLLFAAVDKDAAYPGGDQAWKDFLSSELNGAIPVRNGAKAGTYTIAVQFIVEPDGTVSHVKGLTHAGFGMEQEGERVIKKSKRWEPAIQNGKCVRAYRKQILTFQISKISKKRKKLSDFLFPDKT